ncbi:hypothetical protein IJL65_00400 [bacterium]|nr:hypothetical protein [bacterium]
MEVCDEVDDECEDSLECDHEILFPFEKGETAKPRGFLVATQKKSSVLSKLSKLRTAPFRKEHRKTSQTLDDLTLVVEIRQLLQTLSDDSHDEIFLDENDDFHEEIIQKKNDDLEEMEIIF